MSDDKHTFLATVRWGGSLQNLVGDDLRELARSAITAFRLPRRVQEYLHAAIFAELDKPVPTIDYTKPYSAPFGMSEVTIAFASPKVIGSVGTRTATPSEGI